MTSSPNNSIDDEFDLLFKEEVGMAKVVLTPAAVDADFVTAFDVGESKTVEDSKAEIEKLRMLNFKLLAEKELLERESAKVASDLTAKLVAAETAKEESSTLAGELQKELIKLKAENERLKEGPVRAIKRTGEEVQAEKTLTGANLFLAKRTMLRSVSAPLTEDPTWMTAPRGPRIALSRAPGKVIEADKDERPKTGLEQEKPVADGGKKEAAKPKKERRSSIFSNLSASLASKRRKDVDNGEEGSASSVASAPIKQKKGKKKSPKSK